MSTIARVWNNKGGAVRVSLSRKRQEYALYGLFFAHKRNVFTINIDVAHRAQDTQSLIVLRGLIADGASAAVLGNIFIKKGARGSKTRFEAKALLLSPQARCEIIPALEIDENEVKASHSTYVGRLDEEELFYLQSRGLSEARARQMLMEAFLYPVVRHMKRPGLANLAKLLRLGLDS